MQLRGSARSERSSITVTWQKVDSVVISNDRCLVATSVCSVFGVHRSLQPVVSVTRKSNWAMFCKSN